jgi:cytoskeleton protein RodZ
VGTLGHQLREHREAKGITLEQIGKASNISLSHLHALEEGHYHLLPGPTFTIGFLRQYARCVGLDPDDVIRLYRWASQKEGGPSRERSVEKLGRARRRSIWILAGGVLLLFLLWMALHPGRERPGERVRTIRMPRTSVEEIEKDRLREELGLLEDASRKRVSPQGGAEGLDSAAPGRGEEPAAAQLAPVEVILQALEKTWVHIVVDQEPGYQQNLEPGDRHACRARERVQLKIGNGSGVRVFYNGKVYEKLGKKGDVVQISFPPSETGKER